MATLCENRTSADRSSADLLDLLETLHIGVLKRYLKGDMLYWQGDPAERIFVVKRGKVKTYSISREGQAHIYDIHGAGSLIGVVACFLGGEHESQAEVLEDAGIFVIASTEFRRWMCNNSLFCLAVMRKLAQRTRLLANRVQELTFMDVQQRLKRSLMRLASEHGIATKEGVRIDLDITHKEIAELVGANRCTVTTYLNQFRRQGYLWYDGGHLVIIHPEHINILDRPSRAVVEGNEGGDTRWAREAVGERVDPIKSLDAPTCGMKQVEEGFSREALALPD